ncbi:hypothetical protein G5V59_17055 [Nocardioides sp. W3-2-3]|nr:hypothetical protein [Nocardioides convexus]
MSLTTVKSHVASLLTKARRPEPGRDRDVGPRHRAGAGMSAMVVRPRRPDDLPALAEALWEQQPTSRYPVRDPLPIPVEDFLHTGDALGAWTAEPRRPPGRSDLLDRPRRGRRGGEPGVRRLPRLRRRRPGLGERVLRGAPGASYGRGQTDSSPRPSRTWWRVGADRAWRCWRSTPPPAACTTPRAGAR